MIQQKTHNISNSETVHHGPSKVVGGLINFLRLVWRLLFQLVLHCMDASYDLLRYLRYSNSYFRSTNDRQKLESLLFFNYHKIEKALALPTVKPVFGLDYIGTTLDLAEKWAQRSGDLDAVVFRGAYSALKNYQEHVNQSLFQVRPDLSRQLDSFLTRYAVPNRDPGDGGTITISSEEWRNTIQKMDFEHFIKQRHSVRSFTDSHIPDDTILLAVKLAQRTPSVCNRQCWRVHVYSSPADKVRILSHQNGNNGFGHLADRVILITADLRCFLTSGERHQAMVDGGMFAMTLILAFESQGIASCCLNLCLSSRQEIAFRKTSKISDFETPIMLIALGYRPENTKVAVSARRPTSSMLTLHDLDRESAHND